MNATLRDRLILVEQLFLLAVVAQDETVREKFSLEVSQLACHLKAVEASGDLDDNTILLLSRVSQAIRATTQCMLGCEDILNEAQTCLLSCSSLPLPPDDLLSVSTSPPTLTEYPLLFSSSSGSTGILGHDKLLDACAHRWLVRNIHNPYPTSTQLQIIRDESMTSVERAELWFQEARDVIGWTRLSDEFFTGSINATIASARRVYLEHDDTIPFCIAFAFSKVKATLETLFAEHPASSLTSHVDRSTRALVPVPVDADSSHLNDLLNEEVEDTTPPPPVAGCKRSLPENTTTPLVFDFHRPLKRLRAHFRHDDHPHSEGMHPLSSAVPRSQKSTTEASTHTSATHVTPIQLSGSSFPVCLKSSPCTLALNSTGQRQTDICGNASEMMVVSPDPPVSHGGERNKQIFERSPLVLSERQSSQYVDHGWNPSLGSVPPSLDHPPSDSIGSSHITFNPGAPVDLSVFDWNSIPNPVVETTISNQPASVYVPSSDLAPLNFGITGTSQITVRPDAPVDLSVFDWNSIPNPLVEAPISMNQPASVYVPSSDLAAMNCELPDPLFLKQSTENYPLDDLGLLDDFSLLQFPLPTTFPPDVSASPASFSSDNSTFASPEMDWSVITDFVNQFTTFSAETPSAPSPSSTFDAAPSTPENATDSLLPSPPHEVNKPISLLDPSIPPSAFLPAEPGIFTDDASSMWSLLCGLS